MSKNKFLDMKQANEAKMRLRRMVMESARKAFRVLHPNYFK